MNFLVSTILNKYIGEYVEGLDHLNIDPWGQGTYAVGPLRVKQKILDSLDTPVSIYAAKIDRIFVSIPWLAAFTEGIHLTIDGLQVDAGPPVASRVTLERLKQHIINCIENGEEPDSIIMDALSFKGCKVGYSKRVIIANNQQVIKYTQIDLQVILNWLNSAGPKTDTDLNTSPSANRDSQNPSCSNSSNKGTGRQDTNVGETESGFFNKIVSRLLLKLARGINISVKDTRVNYFDVCATGTNSKFPYRLSLCVAELAVKSTQPSGIINMNLRPKITLRGIKVTSSHAIKSNGVQCETYTIVEPFDVQIFSTITVAGLSECKKVDLDIRLDKKIVVALTAYDEEIFDALGTSFLPYHDENANCYITKETEEKFEESDANNAEYNSRGNDVSTVSPSIDCSVNLIGIFVHIERVGIVARVDEVEAKIGFDVSGSLRYDATISGIMARCKFSAQRQTAIDIKLGSVQCGNYVKELSAAMENQDIVVKVQELCVFLEEVEKNEMFQFPISPKEAEVLSIFGIGIVISPYTHTVDSRKIEDQYYNILSGPAIPTDLSEKTCVFMKNSDRDLKLFQVDIWIESDVKMTLRRVKLENLIDDLNSNDSSGEENKNIPIHDTKKSFLPFLNDLSTNIASNAVQINFCSKQKIILSMVDTDVNNQYQVISLCTEIPKVDLNIGTVTSIHLELRHIKFTANDFLMLYVGNLVDPDTCKLLDEDESSCIDIQIGPQGCFSYTAENNRPGGLAYGMYTGIDVSLGSLNASFEPKIWNDTLTAVIGCTKTGNKDDNENEFSW